MSAVRKIRRLDRAYSMEKFYAEIGGSRQLYAQLATGKEITIAMEQEILDKVRRWRVDHPQMGSRTLFYSMKERGEELPIGVTSFERLMSKHHMTVGIARRSGPFTSDGLGSRQYPNLTNGLVLNDINQLVVADITFFWITPKWHYLFVLKDVYSQRIISLVPSENMYAEKALQNVFELKKLRGEEHLNGCIFHSDNGSQYDSKSMINTLTSLNMRISRSQTCTQNGSSEQGHHIIKNMYLKHYGIQTFRELKIACKKVKRMMNEERSINQLGNMTVQRFEELIGRKTGEPNPIKTLYDFNQT